MISLRSILHFMVHQFTFGLGGGIGEAALIGAAFGGAKAIATGQDPLEAALLGGITGGAMNGIMGAIPGFGGAGVSAGTEVVDQATKDALTQGTIQNGVIQGANTGLNVANTVNPAMLSSGSQGIAGYTGDLAPNFSNVAGGYTAGQAIPVGSDIAGGYTAGQAIPAGTDVSQGVAQASRAADQAAAGSGNTFAKLRDYVGADPTSIQGKALNWAAENPLSSAGILGAGYGVLTKKPYMPPTVAQEKSPLAGYKREQFTPYDAAQPNPYPVASYTGYAEGGEIKSFDQGGIAALANGGPNPGVGSQGMGNAQSYPGARLDMTQYATPSQMPTSSSVINSGYEMQTNPYTGEPNGFAEGGIASFADGGFAINQATQNNTTPSAGTTTTPTAQTYHPSYNPMGMYGIGSNGMGSNNMYGYSNPYDMRGTQQTPTSAFNAASFTPYNPNQQGGANNIYQPQYAEGGPVGYSLGGYAAGGNPRLLKGPGDGMSDNIPAVIGHKQPARLADGEFVVPADVVSHLGNGSTDAGAKHLYHMMDKVRKARTGKVAQGTQINPKKYLPA